MKPLNPIRLHTALRGAPRVGAAVVPRLAVILQTAHRSGSRFGGLPVPA